MEANLIDRDIAEDYFGCSDWEILAKETLREVPRIRSGQSYTLDEIIGDEENE